MFNDECIRWKIKNSALTLLQPEFKDLFQDRNERGESIPSVQAVQNSKTGSAEQASVTKITNFQPAPAHIENQPPKTPTTSDYIQPLQHLNWHLRKKRADLFIDMQADVPFLSDLKKFLQSKGISVLPYDHSVHYLPYDRLLCSNTHIPSEGKYCLLNNDKRNVWEFLKKNFKDKF